MFLELETLLLPRTAALRLNRYPALLAQGKHVPPRSEPGMLPNQAPTLGRTGKTVSRCYFVLRTMNELGRFIFVCGLIIAGIGLLIWSGFGKDWLGRLPGDIHYYGKGNFSFHFPIVTCLLISAILTIFLWLFRK